MDNSWISIAKIYGPLGLIVLALASFLYKTIWPFVVKQIEDSKADRKVELETAKAERKEEIAKFVETIRARDVLMADIQERHVKAIEAIAVEIRGMNKAPRTASRSRK